VKAASSLNQTLVSEKHIRVDTCVGPRGDGENSNDYETTAFIGNLPFSTNEEELRKHFAEATLKLGNASDGILNVRIIRDKETYISKGIAYIQFSSKPIMRFAIEKLNQKEFKGRELRIKKAVAPQRLEKKKMKVEEMV